MTYGPRNRWQGLNRPPKTICEPCPKMAEALDKKIVEEYEPHTYSIATTKSDITINFCPWCGKRLPNGS